MTMVGGSHTAFDQSAFTAGAVGGALSIAGALAAGIANYRAACEADYDAWEERKVRAVLRFSELMRAKERITMIKIAQENAELRAEVERLRRDVVVRKAQQLRR